MKSLNMIVAYCKNRGIGNGNLIPWYIPNDFKYFKRKTSKINNSGIIMGKNTWISLPKKPLKNRENIILSKTLSYSEIKRYKNIKIFSKKSELDEYLTEKSEPSWIIGGEQIYKSYINDPNLNKIYVTYINNDYECDTFFPNIPPNFKMICEGEKKKFNDINYQYLIYKNINNIYNDN